MEKYMRRAIELARLGTGFVNPNPLVGAVIVKDGKIIGEGYHEKYGELHAERNALKNASEDVSGADMFVTLEPCCHHGKQPPCTEAVIESGIKRVFIGSRDPNPLVSGKGVHILRERGISVVTDFLKDECDTLNDIFFHYIRTKTPYVILKTAMTIDGKTAAKTGHSKWITNEKSRSHVHLTRKRVSAIMAGINTVLLDDPLLNCRAEHPSDPIRIICDSRLRTPLTSRIARTAKDISTIIAYTEENPDNAAKLSQCGIELIRTGSPRGLVDLKELMRILGEKGIDSLLIEGGSQIHADALKSGIVNKLQVYIAPKIMGGDGINAVASLGAERADDALLFSKPRITRFDDDILIEYEVNKDVYGNS